MKKTVLFVIMTVSVIALTAYLGIQLIVNNLPNESENNSQDIVKVNVPEKINEVNIEKDVVEEVKVEDEKENPVEVFALIYPVDGEIGMSYSPEELIYSKTLKEWTVHNGVDILAKRGTPVVSSENGKVESITETADNGIQIIITHDNDYKTIYSNLSSKDMVKVGDIVQKGQVISGVGNTSSFEYYEPEHLHFEIEKNGKKINPLDVLVKYWANLSGNKD